MDNDSYTAQVDSLIEQQLHDWATARDNYAALRKVMTRTLKVGKSSVLLQFNPERIRSSAAKLDADTLRSRKCFLCADNRPALQAGIEWGGGYTILVNPYPIFPRHLTIPCNEHTSQRIQGRISDMLCLAHDLHDFVIFYNGPKCGASAPDHMHFQAGNKGFLPFVGELAQSRLLPCKQLGKAQLSLENDLGRTAFIITSTAVDDAVALFDELYAAMPQRADETEPMMNILCWKDGEEWRVVVFPRIKHRPTCYGSGEGQFLISPASVDMGGVFAVPVERDFNKLTPGIVQMMFDELCIGQEDADKILIKLINN
jgi:hypothetical protein